MQRRCRLRILSGCELHMPAATERAGLFVGHPPDGDDLASPEELVHIPVGHLRGNSAHEELPALGEWLRAHGRHLAPALCLRRISSRRRLLGSANGCPEWRPAAWPLHGRELDPRRAQGDLLAVPGHGHCGLLRRGHLHEDGAVPEARGLVLQPLDVRDAGKGFQQRSLVYPLSREVANKEPGDARWVRRSLAGSHTLGRRQGRLRRSSAPNANFLDVMQQAIHALARLGVPVELPAPELRLAGDALADAELAPGRLEPLPGTIFLEDLGTGVTHQHRNAAGVAAHARTVVVPLPVAGDAAAQHLGRRLLSCTMVEALVKNIILASPVATILLVLLQVLVDAALQLEHFLHLVAHLVLQQA
mmetsp:Transcript_20286/g.63769  ORF Transcript_20286/g.63769 Transcript_20286/m.63769 type:complete len:361 (-) Transcript_20286:62-1144(-)